MSSSSFTCSGTPRPFPAAASCRSSPVGGSCIRPTFKAPSLGGVGYENKTDEQGPATDLARQGGGRPAALAARAGEMFSDVILRLASESVV